MTCFGIQVLVAFSLVLSVVVCENGDSGEPHTYTISFFQFNPNDITHEQVRQKSKKDIKPSDTNVTAQRFSNVSASGNNESLVGNITGFDDNTLSPKNTTSGLNNSTLSSNNTALTDVPSHSFLNNTALPDRNKTEKVLNKVKTMKVAANEEFPGKVENITDAQVPLKANETQVQNNNSSATNATQKRSHIKHNHEHKHGVVEAHKKDTLNPNPSPSQTEAVKHLKSPEYDGTAVKSFLHDTDVKKNASLFLANDSVSTRSNETASLTEKSVKLVKTGDAKEASNKTSDLESSAQVKNDSAKSEGATVMVKKLDEGKKQVSNSTENAKNDTAAKQAKLEKDMKINQEIQKNAKSIHAVQNSVENSTSSVLKNTTAKDNDKQTVRSVRPMAMHGVVKNRVSHHRDILSHFIPVYNVNPRDRQLGFQLGSLKHPKHNIYPQCHHCPKNSSYSDCVRKSTLKTCKQGLKNICFSRSMKKHNRITYQMGCADHKKCNNARAFPCKDGSKQCFTCCQFDRCNSSPHHGDYELDELNMDELQLDTSGSASCDGKVNWLYLLCFAALNVFVVNSL